MFRSAGRSITGPVRPINQDAIYQNDELGLWIVADGVGGHNGGEVAANFLCRNVPDKLTQGLDAKTALMDTHQQLLMMSQEDRQLENMATTVVIAQHLGTTLNIYWAGDCRAYVMRQGTIRQVTRDHTVVQELLDIGVINSEQIKHHPKRHIITSCIGGRASHAPKIDVASIQCIQGDRILLCSDGLHDDLSEHRIFDVLTHSLQNTEAVHNLVSLAEQQSGIDNISAVIVDCMSTLHQVKPNTEPSIIDKLKGLLP